MDITKEIDEMAEKMVKANPDVVYAEVKRTIMELGVEGLRKAMPNLSEAHRELLKNVLLEMKTEVTVAKSHKEPIKNSSETLEPDINSTESGDYRQNEDEKPEFTEQDEKLVAIATKKKQDEPRNQGGVPVEGWEGQVIKSEALEKKQGVPEGADPAVHERCVKEVKDQGHDKSSAFAICNAAGAGKGKTAMKKSEFVDTIKRMQERKLEKSQCVQALAKALNTEAVKIEAVWDALAKAEAKKAEKDDGDEAKEKKIGEKIADAVDDAAEGEAEEAVDEHEEKMHAKEKMKKSDSYFYEEESVYMAKSETNPFAVRTVNKSPTYSVDAFIEAEEAAKKQTLAKSTFLYEEGEALIKACGMAKGKEGTAVENPADAKMDGKELLEKDKKKDKEEVKKSQGEGSRGGKVIGHTSSGKPIYDNGHGHGTYNQEDHREAAQKLEHHATKERHAGLDALEQKHGKGNVPKEESKKLIMDNLKRYSDIIDMHQDAASSRNIIPSHKKMKKSTVDINDLIEKSLDMGRDAVVQAQENRKARPQVEFFIKSFDDKDLEAEIEQVDMWGNPVKKK